MPWTDNKYIIRLFKEENLVAMPNLQWSELYLKTYYPWISLPSSSTDQNNLILINGYGRYKPIDLKYSKDSWAGPW